MIGRWLAEALFAWACPATSGPIAFPVGFDPSGTPLQSLQNREQRIGQYRLWDQVLLDVAGQGDKMLVCRTGKTHLVSGVLDPARLPMDTVLGLWAWTAKEPNHAAK